MNNQTDPSQQSHVTNMGQQQGDMNASGNVHGGAAAAAAAATSGMYGINVRNPALGSITQYASPTMQQQQQRAMYSAPQDSPYNFNPPPQPASTVGIGGGAGMSFAQRSAMMQQQARGNSNVYGGAIRQPQVQQPQQSLQYQPQQPPVSQITVPQQHPQQQRPVSNAYPSESVVMSYAQRSQSLMDPSMQRPQLHMGQNENSNLYSNAAGPNNAMRPPNSSTPQQQSNYGGGGSGYAQLQQQPQQPQMQSSYMGSPQEQQQQQQSQIQGSYMGNLQGQQPPPVPGSYAQRSAMMGQSQQLQQPGMVAPQQSSMIPSAQQQQEPGMAIPSQPEQQPRNPLEDHPDVVAQQQRLLTDATRKVQEHAYYMKQAMERNDLPTVLDRAAQMVGELGEHAHAHHHHHIHPPAPGATGSTTALSPKNYYELHLRALEELPTLEDYLLNLSQQQPLPVLPQQQQPPSASASMGPMQASPGNDPLMMGGSQGAANQSMMMNNNGMNSQMMIGQQQQQQQSMIPSLPQPKVSYTMKELYDCVQYCPNVLSRLYLQICAASALIRSGELGARWVMKDMIEAVKCVQNPVRGLFLRHYLLQALRDKLPDEAISVDQIGAPLGTGSAAPSGENSHPVENVATPAKIMTNASLSEDKGTVKDSYEFILANFIEMNKLWVRIQHLPGDGKSKEVRRRREKDRNELRILVGTNLVRLSSLDSITSTIYGQVILPTVLDHIVICADPLAQAYLMDCLVQVFPDEYHIETMPILLGVCPKLRDKVNIRTILQSLMDRLANYLADEELLDEKDSNQVKRSVAIDSFRMFDECVQNVYNARGPKLNPKEVIRLQTALLSFSMKCYQGNMDQVVLCLKNCVAALQSIRNNATLMQDPNIQQQQQAPAPSSLVFDEMATKELEKLLSIPLEELALGVLRLEYYSDLIAFLPWTNRRQVALTMLKAVTNSAKSPESVKEVDEIFLVIAPILRDEHDAASSSHQDVSGGMERTANLMAGLGVSPQPQRYLSQSSYDGSPESSLYQQDAALVSKLIDMLDHPNTDVLYEMLTVARNHLNTGKKRVGTAYMAMVFASLKLARRIYNEEHGLPKPAKETKEESTEGVVESKSEENGNGTDEFTEGESKPDEAKIATEAVQESSESTEAKDLEKKEPALGAESAPAEEKELAITPKTIT